MSEAYQAYLAYLFSVDGIVYAIAAIVVADALLKKHGG
jgi:hypothetical protein